MQGPTIIISVLCVIAALVATPARAMCVLIVGMVAWPDYLRIEMGLSQMSVARFTAIALLIRLMMSPRRAGLKLHLVDWLVIIWWVWDVIANMLAGAESSHVNWTIGRAMDTVFPYFCARLAFQSMSDLRECFWPMAMLAAFNCLAGVYESVTFGSPYERLFAYHEWIWMSKEGEFRLGFLRAKAGFAHAIYWGMANVLLAGLLLAIRPLAPARWAGWLAFSCAVVAALTSLSSGPMGAIVILVLCAAISAVPSLIRPAIWTTIGMCIFFEAVSNRHFFQLIDYLALNKSTGWYRAKLIEVAAARWHEYWAVGVGGRWPHHWGMLIDGRQHVDVVNNYIIVALSGGLVGMLLFAAVQVRSMIHGVRGYRATSGSRRKVFAGLVSTLVAVMCASMSVGLYGPPNTMGFIHVGIMTSLGLAALSAKQGLIAPRATTPRVQETPIG